MTDDQKMRVLNETFKDFHHARRRTIGYCWIHVKGGRSTPRADKFTPSEIDNYVPQNARLAAANDGARREGRTPTLLREPDFESGASASSAIRA